MIQKQQYINTPKLCIITLLIRMYILNIVYMYIATYILLSTVVPNSRSDKENYGFQKIYPKQPYKL